MTTRERKRERRIRWGARLGPALIRVLASTWRITRHNTESFAERRAVARPVIFALWHEHLLPLLWCHRGEGVAVLISTHADGEIIARICAAFGYSTVRGSSTRGGARALVEVVRTLEQGIDLAFTPDGPRGPARSVAPGVVYAAQRSGAPIIPIGVHASREWRLRTWDRFMIPKPFARLTIRYGDPMFLESESSQDDIERESELLAHTMQSLEAPDA